MQVRNALFATVAGGALVAAGAAQAQLAAEDVWAQWLDTAAMGGQTVSVGSESKAGGVLTLTDVIFAADLPDDDGTVMVTLDQVTFAEQGDGSVAVAMSDSYPMTMTFPDMAQGDSLIVTISHPGLTMSASGRAGAIDYVYAVPEMRMELTEAIADGVDLGAIVRMRAGNVAGSYSVTEGDVRGLTSSTTMGTLDLIVEFEDPAGMGHLNVLASLSGIGLEFTGAGLDSFDGEDIGAALQSGFAVDFTTSYDKASLSLDFEDWGEQTTFNGSASNATTRIALNAEEAIYSASSRNSSIAMSGADIPVSEVLLGTAETDLHMRLPLAALGDSQDASVLIRLVDLTVDDETWSMADPVGVFPNDPMTLILDLAATVVLNGDLYDEDMLFGMMMFGPLALGEARDLTLRQLLVRAVGAELLGDAAFTFDFSDMETIPGVPKPTGALNLALKGGNALLDKLISMGVVGPDEAMGMRMGMAMFTRPGPGEDELVSTIEVREDGAILANGQRIQ